jgi:hypothetical protein
MKAVGALALLTVAFYWKLTLTRQFTFVISPDLADQVLPWYQMQARAWQDKPLPLWDPYQWCGQPLAGQYQPGALYPLNWPLFLLPLREGRLNLDYWHWHFVAMHGLAAGLMYWYCRKGGRSRTASVLGGAAFSYGGYVGTTLWPQMMNGAVWTPLVFGLLDNPGVRGAALGGAALGFALLAGHHQPMIFVALAVAGLLAARREWRRLGVVVVFAGLCGAAALLPAYEYGVRAYRWVGLEDPVRGSQTVPYRAHEPFGVEPLSLLGLITPLDKGTVNPFVGLTVVALALAAVASRWTERNARLQGCLALGGLAYAVGAYSVVQGVLYAVLPMVDKARSPGHAIAVTHFALAAMAARGVDCLGEASWARERVVKALAGAGVLAWLGGMAVGTPSDRSHTVMLTATVALLLAAAVWRGSQKAALGLLLLEQAAGTNHLYVPRSELERLEEHRGIAEFLRRQPGPFRIWTDDRYVKYNFGDWHGLEDTGGYLASVSADLYDFVRRDWAGSPLRLNQVFVISKERTRPNQEEVFAEDGLKVFRNPDAGPRAWLEPACERAGSVEWLERRLDRVRLRVEAGCRTRVVMADPAYPGWRARVDGRSAPVEVVERSLRAVAVEAGSHVVELAYRPASVYLGAALSVTGLLLALALRRRADDDRPESSQ